MLRQDLARDVSSGLQDRPAVGILHYAFLEHVLADFCCIPAAAGVREEALVNANIGDVVVDVVGSRDMGVFFFFFIREIGSEGPRQIQVTFVDVDVDEVRGG